MYLSFSGLQLPTGFVAVTTRQMPLEEKGSNKTHGDNGADFLAGLSGASGDGRRGPVAVAGADGRRNNHDRGCVLGVRGGDGGGGHDGGDSRLRGVNGSRSRSLHRRRGPSRRSLRHGSNNGLDSRLRSGLDGRLDGRRGIGDGRMSLNSGLDRGLRVGLGRDSCQSGAGNGNRADVGCSRNDDGGGSVSVGRAVSHGSSAADDGGNLSLRDGAGSPLVRDFSGAAARVNIVPLIAAVVVTAVHGNVVRRVPDIRAVAGRGTLGAVSLGLKADAERQLDVEA